MPSEYLWKYRKITFFPVTTITITTTTITTTITIRKRHFKTRLQFIEGIVKEEKGEEGKGENWGGGWKVQDMAEKKNVDQHNEKEIDSHNGICSSSIQSKECFPSIITFSIVVILILLKVKRMSRQMQQIRSTYWKRWRENEYGNRWKIYFN